MFCDVTHNEQYPEVIGPPQLRNSGVYVLGMQPMVFQTKEQDAGRPTDVVVGHNITEFFPDMADVLEDRIQALVGIYDDVVPSAWLDDWRLCLGGHVKSLKVSAPAFSNRLRSDTTSCPWSNPHE